MVNLEELHLPRENSWYYENGYLTIDLELFGKYLSVIFSEYLGKHYQFQTFNPKIQTRKDIPIWQQEEDERKMAIISPLNNDDKYNKVQTINAKSSKPNGLHPYTIYSKEYDTLFAKKPIELDESEFLLYFGINNPSDIKLTLGHIEDEKFVCHNFSNIYTEEVKYKNNQYPFIDEFIKTIFYYKVVNIKPNIDENDMDSILSLLGITKEERIEKLINILKNIRYNSTECLLNANNVGNTLKLTKK